MSRPHRKADRGFRPRPTPGREQRQRFLIVCEGEKSEPAYFRAGYAPVAHVHGAARDPVGVVEKAIELRDRASKDLRMGRPYDQIWCVFDRDDVPAQRFNDAIALAEREGFHIAYSNQAFELWYVLHFDYCNTAIPRAAYGARLNTVIAWDSARPVPAATRLAP